MKRIAVIINPTSGGGRTLIEWPRIEAQLVASGYRITKHVSTSEVDFRAQARAFARLFPALGICGGDSSLTIAAEELLSAKFKGNLLFLPAGSVNDIVRDIELHTDRRDYALYLGSLAAGDREKLFIGQANWGLGVVVNRWVGHVLHRMPFLRPLQETIGTICIIVAHVLRREKISATLYIGNQLFSGNFSIILVTQLSHWASGLSFAPAADYCSPRFQIVTVRRTSLIRLIRIILAARTGAHLAFAEVESFAAESVAILLSKPAAVQIDGDILRDIRRELKFPQYHLQKRRSSMRLSAISPESLSG
jgi:diacylglycerol kinase (ATP)